MPDYQKGKIYKLYSVSNEELVYYGSTIQELSVRLAGHVRDYKNNTTCKSKFVIDAGDYKMELIENYPCVNRGQLERREGEFTKNNVCVNKIIVGRTKKEYYEDNKEAILKHNKQYCQNNKEKVALKRKENYENNKEKILEKNKQYRENNKEIILEKMKEKVTCECGCIISKIHLGRHKKTNKHLGLMKD